MAKRKVQFSLERIFLLQVGVKNLTELLGMAVLITLPWGEKDTVKIRKINSKENQQPLTTVPTAEITLWLEDGKMISVTKWVVKRRTKYSVSYLDTHGTNLTTHLAAGIEIGPALKRISHPGKERCSPLVVNR